MVIQKTTCPFPIKSSSTAQILTSSVHSSAHYGKVILVSIIIHTKNSLWHSYKKMILGDQWELRYGLITNRSWDGWLECKCDSMGDCEWYNKGQPANEFIHCVPPGAIRRDGQENQSTTDLLDFGIE